MKHNRNGLSGNSFADDTQDEYQGGYQKGYQRGYQDDSQDENEPKGNIATMIILAILYIGLAVIGYLMAFTNKFDGAVASIGLGGYAKTIGLLWLTTVPSFGYYFATLAPFQMPKPAKIIIFVLSLLLSIAAVVLFFLLTERMGATKVWDDEDRVTMPIMVIVGAVGLLLCYALTVLRTNAQNADLNDKDTDGEANVFALFFKGILNLFVFFGILVLGFKEKRPNIFIVIVVLLLTYFNFFTAIFVLFILGGIVFSLFALLSAGLLGIAASMPDTHERYEIEDDYGNKRILTYSAYEGGHEVYRADDGEEWLTDDNGQTFYQKK